MARLNHQQVYDLVFSGKPTQAGLELALFTASQATLMAADLLVTFDEACGDSED